MFGNPVPGYIHAKGWTRPPINLDFVVTSTFAEHVASGRGPGLDMGNAHEGTPVLSAEAGVVDQVFRDPGNGAIIVRIRHPQLGNVLTGYAHLQRIETRAGIQVARGVAIGHVGSTGAPGQPHLHFGVNIDGREVDGWPLLDQNGDDMIKGVWVQHVSNRKTKTLAGARFRSEPTLAASTILATLPAGVEVLPVAGVTGQVANGSTLWFVAILDSADAGLDPDTVGYIHSTAVEQPLVEVETSALIGHTDEELAKAAEKAAHDAAHAVAAASVTEAASYKETP